MQLLNILLLLLLTQSCYGTLRHNYRNQLRRTEELDSNNKGGNTQCGTSICSKDEFCCNESCSMCAPLGSMCTQQYCESEVEESKVEESKEEYKKEMEEQEKEEKNEEEEEEEKAEKKDKDTKKHDNSNDDEFKCGTTSICSAGEYCCNPSCGICAPLDGGCILMICNNDDDTILPVVSSDLPSLSPSNIPSDVPSITPTSLSSVDSKLDSDSDTHTTITHRCFNMTNTSN